MSGFKQLSKPWKKQDSNSFYFLPHFHQGHHRWSEFNWLDILLWKKVEMRHEAKRNLRLRFGGVGWRGGVYTLEIGYKHHMQHKMLLQILTLYLRLISIIQFESTITFCLRRFHQFTWTLCIQWGEKWTNGKCTIFCKKFEW